MLILQSISKIKDLINQHYYYYQHLDRNNSNNKSNNNNNITTTDQKLELMGSRNIRKGVNIIKLTTN